MQQAEAEFNRLNRRVQELEEDLANTQTKCQLGVSKLDKAAETADNSDRMAKVLQNRAADDEKKMLNLAEQLKEASPQTSCQRPATLMGFSEEALSK